MGSDPWQPEVDALVAWIGQAVQAARAKGAVVALSGGIDSAVVAHLLGRALPGATLGVLLPCHSDGQDLIDGQLAAQSAGIPTVTVQLDEPYDALCAALQASGEPTAVALANVKPRLRMNALYYHAARTQSVVFGTGNRAELELGYFTKYGDGGVDFLPLGGYLKAEVRQLAVSLGVPPRIIARTPSAGLWAGQTDEGEMGLTYAEIDAYLASGTGDPSVIEQMESMRQKSRHKLAMPPIFVRPGGAR
ncbi:MAG: NAD(+) synthase [Sulfobacillus sp.]